VMPQPRIEANVNLSLAAVATFLLVLLLGAAPARAAVPVFGYEIVHAYPHDPHAFTEGLFYLNGFLYESTGLEQQSSIRKVKLETGKSFRRSTCPRSISVRHRQLEAAAGRAHVEDADRFRPRPGHFEGRTHVLLQGGRVGTERRMASGSS